MNQACTIDLTISTGITMNVFLPITASAITFGRLVASMVVTTAGTSAAAATSAAHTILVDWAGAY